MIELNKRLRRKGSKDRRGFTLVELAIVLVVIGLIIGMAFKGKQLIDGAKVKNLAAQYNKIVAAINTFYERYGFYPGDGCTSATPSSPTECTGPKDGLIQNNEEQKAFWYLLIDVTHILTRADKRSVFGQDWQILEVSYLNRPPGNWLDLSGYEQADARIVCALDKLIDDGNSGTGIVRGFTSGIVWDENTDCWSLSGQCDFQIKVLP